MDRESRQCQNCKATFVIEPDDFAFYEKISVPPPTWCPECRLVRRLVWRNERTFYRHPCQAPGHSEQLITFIAPEKPYTVYDQKYWWSDEWDATSYGREYNFSKPFFLQLKELLHDVPIGNLTSNYATLINSEYSNWAGELRNCYLVTDADYVEDSAYSSAISHSKDCYDCDSAIGCELCYGCFDIEKCYRTVGSFNCQGCTDVLFSKNCSGCTNCFGCINLRGKSYHIFNRSYSKAAYAEEIKRLWDGSRRAYVSLLADMGERWLRFPEKFMRGFMNTNASGNYVYNSKNVGHGFLISDVEDSKFIALTHMPRTKNCYDYTDWGENVELCYECMTCGYGVSNSKFCFGAIKQSRAMQYSYFSINCSNIFGCSSLKKKSYCILNKQYSKEEYETLLPKIIEHMNAMPYVDARGRVYKYGEFFPPELSHFAYNETAAQEFFTLTKEEATAAGFPWRDAGRKNYAVTLEHSNVPETIDGVTDAVLNDIIACEHEGNCNQSCSTAFRIILPELNFYRRMNLPLPCLCPNCRHYERLKNRLPLKLWHRMCQCTDPSSVAGGYHNATTHQHGAGKCPNEFETSYAPDRPEIVYCEQCYNAEVA